MSRKVALVVSIIFLAACNDSTATSEAIADSVPTAVAVEGQKASAAEVGGVDSIEESPVSSIGQLAEEKAVQPRSASTQRVESVASLPLRRGFYVTEGATCEEASNATLMLVRKGGINTSRVPCDFKSIVKAGPSDYRVTESCSEGGPAWGSEEQVSSRVSTYEVLSETSFRMKSGDWEYIASYCPQPSLPEPWRENDISDIVAE